MYLLVTTLSDTILSNAPMVWREVDRMLTQYVCLLFYFLGFIGISVNLYTYKVYVLHTFKTSTRPITSHTDTRSLTLIRIFCLHSNKKREKTSYVCWLSFRFLPMTFPQFTSDVIFCSSSSHGCWIRLISLTLLKFTLYVCASNSESYDSLHA